MENKLQKSYNKQLILQLIIKSKKHLTVKNLSVVVSEKLQGFVRLSDLHWDTLHTQKIKSHISTYLVIRS